MSERRERALGHYAPPVILSGSSPFHPQSFPHRSVAPFGLLSLHLSLHQVLQLQPCNTLNLLSVGSSRRLSGSSLVVTASRLSHSSSHTSGPSPVTRLGSSGP